MPLIDLFRQGGAITQIVLACGLLAFFVFVERSLHLHRARIKTEDFLKGIFNILLRDNVAEALSICDDTPGPVAYVVKTAILHRHQDKEYLRRALDEAAQAETSRMERRLVVIASVAQITPLLGLLGTILGLIESSAVMQVQAPLLQWSDVSGGLMKALVATAAGLTVAIPCYAAFNILVVKIDRIVLDVDRAASEMLGFLANAERVSQEKDSHATHR
jgi:biopolymer transport protein ExbB